MSINVRFFSKCDKHLHFCAATMCPKCQDENSLRQITLEEQREILAMFVLEYMEWYASEETVASLLSGDYVYCKKVFDLFDEE